MQPLTLISLLILGLIPANPKMRSGNLNGTWQPVKQEMGGAALPSTSFSTQRLMISDSAYTVIAESVDRGVIHYKDGKMDIYGRQGVNAGRHFTAIYKFGNEQLTICYNLSGDSYPQAYETTGKPRFFLSVFKNVSNP